MEDENQDSVSGDQTSSQSSEQPGESSTTPGDQPTQSVEASPDGAPAAEGEAQPAEPAPEPTEITLSMIEFKALQEKIQSLGNEVAENRDKYLRALAEFENYKKRVMKERADILKYQGEKVFQDILEIVDNFDLAKAHENSDPVKWKAGIDLIQKRFFDILRKWDVRAESAIGKDFDPNLHNALSRLKVDDAKPGTVIGELKKPYFYKDKLLRVGEVVVAEGTPPPEDKPVNSDDRKEGDGADATGDGEEAS